MRKAISWRARVASAVRAALAGSLTLALCGCIFPPTLTSDATTLPREARVIEPGLEGDFWLPEGPDGDARFEVATISRDADNRYHFVYRDESGDVSWSSDEDGAAAEVIRTRHPGIDVVMMQVDERTLYSLAFASRGGTWLLFPFIGGVDQPEAGLREKYLAQIARRHGLELKFDGTAGELQITGRPAPTALDALFSDPDFLTGLQLDAKDGKRLFPARLAKLPAQEDGSAWWSDAYTSQLSGDPFTLARAEQVQPKGIAGRYAWDKRPVNLVAQADGSFAVVYPPVGSARESWSTRLHLLPLGNGASWLGISEPSRGADGTNVQGGDGYTFSMVSRDRGGTLLLTGICLSDPQFSATLASLVRENRSAASARHGILFDHARMSGSLTPENLRALLADPRFRVGLAPDQEATCGTQVLQPAKRR